MKEEKEAEIMKGEDEEKKEKLEKICSVSWQGEKEKKEILIGKDFVDNFFSEEEREIILHIADHKCYSELPPAFFTDRCLRTAYDDQTYKGTNRLHEWVINSNVRSAKLEVFTKYKEFRLSKYELNAFNI